MKYLKTISSIFISTCILVNTAFSESNISETGEAGLSFLTIAPSSRIASLGSGGTALMTGASSIWSNPSLIALQKERSVQFTHTKWIQDINQEYVAFSTEFDYGILGLGAHLFNSGDIEGRDNNGAYTGSYNITNTALSVTYARMLNEWIALGLTYKKLFQKISDENAGGYAFDGGITVVTPLKGFTIGASARNYGRMGVLKSTRTKLPSNVSVGCIYSDMMPRIELPYSVIADVIFPRFGETGVRLGMEVEAIENFAVRMSYRSDSDFEDFCFGIGYRWEMVFADISYSPMNDISDDAMRITLSITGF